MISELIDYVRQDPGYHGLDGAHGDPQPGRGVPLQRQTLSQGKGSRQLEKKVPNYGNVR